jgi:hypothetical protein
VSSRATAASCQAVTVADRWQGRGLGSALLGLLSERARTVGVLRFTVDMLADNAAVLALVRNAGAAGEEVDGHIITGHIPLEPVLVPLSGPALLRTAAAESVVAVPQPIAATVPWAGTRARAVVALEE